jgi:protein-S-isoprenylcysteine O-methyltransferase Ste14
VPTEQRGRREPVELGRGDAVVMVLAAVAGVSTALSSWLAAAASSWVRWLFTAVAGITLVIGAAGWRTLRKERAMSAGRLRTPREGSVSDRRAAPGG